MTQDERIEAVARAFCAAARLDPDLAVTRRSGAFTRLEEQDNYDTAWLVPQWMNFRSMAFDRLAMDLAVSAVLNRPQGPEGDE